MTHLTYIFQNLILLEKLYLQGFGSILLLPNALILLPSFYVVNKILMTVAQ